MNSLNFLEKFINPRENEYEQPSFLKSNFLDDVWIIEYSDKKTSIIDFKVKMGDGLFLTNDNLDILPALKDEDSSSFTVK